jgi:hypothetical protein
MVEDVKISAKRQYEENKMKSAQSESEEEV